jgi:ankyrin repeat protein
MTADDIRAARFFTAVESGDVNTVRTMAAADPGLLSCHCKDDQKQPDKTALHIAVKTSNHLMLETLLDLGAPIDATDRYGLTPLLYSAQYKDRRIAELLIAAGADPRETTDDGLTTVMLAAEVGAVPLVELFVSKGVDVNALRSGWMTALHFARNPGNAYETVCCLLAAGADPARTGPGFETAAELATRMGNPGYGKTIIAAQRAVELKAEAKALTDRQDQDVLANGLPQEFAVRKPFTFKK